MGIVLPGSDLAAGNPLLENGPLVNSAAGWGAIAGDNPLLGPLPGDASGAGLPGGGLAGGSGAGTGGSGAGAGGTTSTGWALAGGLLDPAVWSRAAARLALFALAVVLLLGGLYLFALRTQSATG